MTNATIQLHRNEANKRVNDGMKWLKDNAIIQDSRDYWFWLVQLRRAWMGIYGLDKLKKRK